MAKQVKQVLNMGEMQDGFFAGSAMIGIVTATPAYHLCWLLNDHFDINFVRDPAQNILMRKKEIDFNFPVYCYDLPNSTYRYLLYKLKDGTESLLPETKRLDYVWLIQTGDPEIDALAITAGLRSVAEIQLAQILDAEDLKNLSHLLV